MKIKILVVVLLLILGLSGYSLIRKNSDSKENGVIGQINKPAPTQAIVENEVQAWLYPGEPSCSAMSELGSKIKTDVVKVEYFTIGSDGNLKLIGANSSECNGYSVENLNQLKKYAKKIYITVSGHQVEMSKMFANKNMSNAAVETLVNFVKENQVDGVELDFEDFSAWTTDDYRNYLSFVRALTDKLHKNGNKMMVDGPAIANSEQQGWYKWRYEDFEKIEVDEIVVMAYDFQNDQGVGSAITPTDWLIDSTNWIKSKIKDKNRIVIGLPAYGYEGKVGSFQAKILTKSQMMGMKEFRSEGVRDSESKELFWRNGNSFGALSDQVAIDYKYKVVSDLGIGKISIWHLGGNDWVSR